MPTLYVFYAEGDDTPHTAWTDDESVRWNEDGSITLADGRVARRRNKSVRSRQHHHVERESLALASPGADLKKQLAQDRRVAGSAAPDFYRPNGKPVWKGDSITTRRRMRRYCQAIGCRRTDDYA